MYNRAVLFLLSFLCAGCQMRDSIGDGVKSLSAPLSSSSEREGTRPSGAEGPTNPPSPAAEEVVMPVIQEELQIKKQPVETGRVRVTKRVHERDELVDVPIMREEVEIERVPIDQLLEGPVGIRQEGETLIIPVVEEVLVVEKRLRLKEELHVRKRQRQSQTPQRIRLRQEEAVIERLPSQPEAGSAGSASTEPGSVPKP
jgi:uncharacterized protein (TIGR02271 family)